MKIKKSQAEIVGMLMIVVIIAFLLLFVFKGILSDKRPDMTSTERENEVSATINAILRTSSDCTPDTDFRDLIIDCTKDSLGTESEIKCRDDKDTCTYAHDEISTILSKTLGGREIPYEFIVYNPSHVKVFNISSVKAEDMDRVKLGQSSVQAATQPLPIGFGYGTLEIKLCLGGNC